MKAAISVNKIHNNYYSGHLAIIIIIVLLKLITSIQWQKRPTLTKNYLMISMWSMDDLLFMYAKQPLHKCATFQYFIYNRKMTVYYFSLTSQKLYSVKSFDFNLNFFYFYFVLCFFANVLDTFKHSNF